MLVPKGEGSGTPIEPHHTPSFKALPTSHTTYSSPTLPPVPTAPIPTVTPSETTPIRQYTRRARIAQSSAPLLITDGPASPLRDVSQGEACPTDFGFIADQDRVNIAQSYTLPHDPAPRVTLPAAVEGSMQHIIDELTTLCTSLQRKNSEMIAKLEDQEVEINRLKARVKLLKDREGVAAKRSRDDAPIKGRNLDEGEAAAERVSDDSEEMANVLTSIDAATILAGGVAEVPTSSGSIPTASPPATRVATGSDVVPTASLIFATATYSQVSARVSTICFRIASGKKELISDLIKYQDNYAKIYKYQSQQRNPLIKKQHREFYTAVLRNKAGWKAKHFKGMTLEEIKENFDPLWKQLHDFVPIDSKEEAKRFKRKGTRFEQEIIKKLKTSEEVPEEVKSPDEVYTEGKRSYWKITRLGGSSASYQLFVDMLKHLDREDLNQLWRIVEESLSNRPPTSDKEMELLVELNRLYEPDEDDQLWTYTQNLMHALVEWKLYDSCGVHHVTARDKEIFMLVEKDYPLRKGLAIVMISYKLQVKNYSRMANDLILKIFKISSTPRQQDLQRLNSVESLLFYKVSHFIPTVTSSKTTPIRQYTRRARIAQSSALPPIADEPASPLRDVSQGEACPTDSGFIADQDNANIAMSSTFPYDPAPRVTSPAAVKGSMQHIIDELMALCTSLQRQYSEMIAKIEAQEVEINKLKAKVKLLEDREGVAAERSKDDAPIKGRNLDEGEAAVERVSDDSEEMETVLTSMDAATVLASGVAEVHTGSGSIPTVSPLATGVATGSAVVPTASPIFATATESTQYTRRKGKETMAGWKAKHFKGMTLEEIKENFELVWKQLHDFVPIGSKEEAKRFKRKGTRFKQESIKKLKTSEEVPEEVKSPDEVPKENVKEMMQLHLDKEDLNKLWRIVKESLSNRPPTSDKEMELWVELNRLYEPDEDDQLDKEIFMLVEKDYPLRKGLAIVMISYKLQLEHQVYGRIVKNKMHKAFLLPVIEFPLLEEVPTASEESSHCEKKRDATAKRIALLGKCPMITPRL
uniref:Uncharacterized protein n=1 Tax=Tanacetum cinerariifolium TaxID=118510 RepID=A0A699I063_TANCI|nr:hypothetical protein [Tanacetum cinerariifolium]